jgi:hypothetical protein
LKELPDSPTQAFHALGNAVNSKVVERVAGALLAGNHPRPVAAPPISTKTVRKRKVAA